MIHGRFRAGSVRCTRTQRRGMLSIQGSIHTMTRLSKKLLCVCGVSFAASAVLIGAQYAYGALDSIGFNGVVTTSFKDGYLKDAYASDVIVQGDGKILLIGAATTADDESSRIALARYNADGTLDPTYASGGKQVITSDAGYVEPTAAALQANGNLVVVGFTMDFSDPLEFFSGSLIARFDFNGGVNNSFFNTYSFGYDTFGYADDVAVLDNGESFAVGNSNGQFAVANFTNDGYPQTGFDSDGELKTDLNTSDNNDYGAATGVAVGDNGTITVGGEYISGSDKPYFAVVRYESDGTLDTDFSGDGKQTLLVGSAGQIGSVSDLALQADGKIVLAGTTCDEDCGGLNIALARFNGDGSLDTSFSDDGFVEVRAGQNKRGDGATSMAIQSDGKIVVAGYSKYPDSAKDSSLVALRFLSDGSLDTTFSGDGRQAISVDSGAIWGSGVELDSDGNILVAGGYDPHTLGADAKMLWARFEGGDVAPISTTLPTLGGTPEYGDTLTCAPGEWADDPSLFYSWFRNDTKITAATEPTRTLSLLDAGQDISCRVNADWGAWLDQETTEEWSIPKAATMLRNLSSRITRWKCSTSMAVKGYCFKITSKAQLVAEGTLEPVKNTSINVKRVNVYGVATNVGSMSTNSTGNITLVRNFKPPSTNTLAWVRNYYKRTRFTASTTSRTTSKAATILTTIP